MNKSQLVEAVAKKTKESKKATETALVAIIDTIKGSLKKGDDVQLIGFGSFKVKKRAARKVRNPKTGKEMNVPAKKYPKFTAGKAFKDAVK